MAVLGDSRAICGQRTASTTRVSQPLLPPRPCLTTCIFRAAQQRVVARCLPPHRLPSKAFRRPQGGAFHLQKRCGGQHGRCPGVWTCGVGRRGPGGAQLTRPGAASSETAVAASAGDLPQTAVEMVEQAAGAVRRALAEGKERHLLRLLLPINEKEANFNALDPVDYPCSLAKEFTTAVNLTRLLLEKLEQKAGQKLELQQRRLDDGGVEGEPCSVIYPDTMDIAAVVFPTAERLKDMRRLAEKAGRPLLIINPQWRESGQVISDFGIGPWKKAAMDFLDTFAESYSLAEQRIGSPGSVDVARNERYTTGAVVRILRSWPSKYQVYVMAPNGSRQLAGEFEGSPSYSELDTMVIKARKAKLEIFEVARKSSARFNEASDPVDAGPAGPEGAAAGERAGAGAGPSTAEVDSMDATALRKLLMAKGLPTAGKLDKLRSRVKEVYLID